MAGEKLKGKSFKNSAKYKKNFESIPLNHPNEKSLRERSRSKNKDEDATENFNLSRDESSRQTLTSGAGKLSKNQLRKERSEEFVAKPNQDDGDNDHGYMTSAAIQRGTDRLGIDFQQVKKEASLQNVGKSPRDRFSVKENEIKIGFHAEKDSSLQDPFDGKSGSELPGHSNWLPVNQTAKESMDKIENDYKDLECINPEDPYNLNLPEGVNCTESSVMKQPGGLTLLDDEDGFMAKDIFAALESVQKGFKDDKYKNEAVSSKKTGLKGNLLLPRTIKLQG